MLIKLLDWKHMKTEAVVKEDGDRGTGVLVLLAIKACMTLGQSLLLLNFSLLIWLMGEKDERSFTIIRSWWMPINYVQHFVKPKGNGLHLSPDNQWQCDHSPRTRHPGVRSQVGLRTRHYKQTWWKWWNYSWAFSNPKRWCCESAALNMPANLENSAVATGLEKVCFHSNPKEK